jgi:hypothetical protein
VFGRYGTYKLKSSKILTQGVSILKGNARCLQVYRAVPSPVALSRRFGYKASPEGLVMHHSACDAHSRSKLRQFVREYYVHCNGLLFVTTCMRKMSYEKGRSKFGWFPVFQFLRNQHTESWTNFKFFKDDSSPLRFLSNFELHINITYKHSYELFTKQKLWISIASFSSYFILSAF